MCFPYQAERSAKNKQVAYIMKKQMECQIWLCELNLCSGRDLTLPLI